MANPFNSYSIGQTIKILRHNTFAHYKTESYQGHKGTIQYATSIFGDHKQKLYEQVMVAIRNGPVIILKILGSGPDMDKISLDSTCGDCGENKRHCYC